jgi:hypothetical protein
VLGSTRHVGSVRAVSRVPRASLSRLRRGWRTVGARLDSDGGGHLSLHRVAQIEQRAVRDALGAQRGCGVSQVAEGGRVRRQQLRRGDERTRGRLSALPAARPRSLAPAAGPATASGPRTAP